MSTRTMRARCALALRSGDHRRLRRRSQRLYCRTNGCATFMELDRRTGRVICPVCTATRAVD
jgi:hypothetical protein